MPNWGTGLFGIAAMCTVALGAAAFAEPAQSRSFTFTYTAGVTDVPAGAEKVVLWIPMPQTTAYQQIDDVRVESTWPYELVTDAKYGNTFARLERPAGISEANDEAVVRMTFRVTREVRLAFGEGVQNASVAPEDLSQYLGASRLIKIEGPVIAEALAVAGEVTDPLSRAKRLYDNIVDTVVYDKSGEGWGRGDTLYACDAREGNCTDFHSLFIGEARYLRIPSRFLMGFSIPRDATEGVIGGYHCWAEFHDRDAGWIPIDASEAFKQPAKREFFFGGLDADRVQFTVGRDITLPGMAGAPVNYSIYPHVEVDGESHSGVTKSFAFREIDAIAERD